MFEAYDYVDMRCELGGNGQLCTLPPGANQFDCTAGNRVQAVLTVTKSLPEIKVNPQGPVVSGDCLAPGVPTPL